MSDPYIGEIRMFGSSFAPSGWAFCNGAPIPISENDTLFTLIGTIYGGDGQETFNLPNLQGRIPIHMGEFLPTQTTYQIGQMAGVETVTLSTQQMPIHTHPVIATSNIGTEANPNNNILATLTTADPYIGNPDPPPEDALNANSIAPQGGSQPHDNMMPYLAVSFILSLYGIFPSQT